MTGRVVVVGSANTDHVVQVSRLPAEGETVAATGYLTSAGGKGLNQAVAAARQGVAVAFIGCVGSDAAGADLLALLAAEGIESSGVAVADDVPTGVAQITVARDGANTVVVAALANHHLSAHDVDAAAGLIDSADVVLVQLEIPPSVVQHALARGRRAGAITVLNPAPAAGPLPSGVLSLTDVLVPNQTEAAALTSLPVEQAGAALLAGGCGTVVVTCGAAGALATNQSGTQRVPAFAVEAVDSTAAGDAFCGVLAAALSTGEGRHEALLRASVAGALAASAPGAVPSLPTREAIDRLMAGRR